MLYFIWLPLLALRSFLSGYFGVDTLILTIIINAILVTDFASFLLKNDFYFGKILLFLFLASTIVLINKAALGFLNTILAVYLLRNLAYEDFLNLLWFISLLFIFIFFVLFFLGIKENVIVDMPKGQAYSLGFENTNTASFFFMTHLMVLTLFLYNRSKVLSFLILPLYWMVYYFTLGRTGFYAELFFYFSIFVISLPNFIRLSFIFRFLPIFLFLFLVFLTYFSNLYSGIDDIFTTRFSIYNKILDLMTPFNYFFGLEIPEGQPMDSSFYSLLFDGGVFYLLIFFYLYERYYHNVIRLGDLHYIPFVVFMLAAGFSENIFSSFNVLSVMMFKIFYDGFYLYKSRAKGVCV